MNVQQLTDDEVITQVLAGNSNRYKILVDRYKSYVFSAAFKIVNKQEDAEDVAQEAFTKAYRALEKFNQDSKFSTWLYRIAVNTALTHRRKRKFYTEDVSEVQIEQTVTTKSNLRKEELKKYLDLAFQQLSEDDVVVLTLFYLKELSLDEIAEITDFEANNVKVKLYRARKRLAEKMKLILQEEVNSLL